MTVCHHLTERRIAILKALSDGDSAQEIADRMGVSLDTVKTTLRRIYATMGARNGRHAVALAFRHRLIR